MDRISPAAAGDADPTGTATKAEAASSTAIARRAMRVAPERRDEGEWSTPPSSFQGERLRRSATIDPFVIGARPEKVEQDRGSGAPGGAG